MCIVTVVEEEELEEEEEGKMRRTRSWEGKKQFSVAGESKRSKCVPRQGGNQYAAQQLWVCVCPRAHTRKVLFVSTIRLKAILYQGLIFKALQMKPKPWVEVVAPAGFVPDLCATLKTV